jgi:DNA-binding CsgD family transcriptional regulator
MKNFSSFFVNLFSDRGARQSKGEPVKTPPAYSQPCTPVRQDRGSPLLKRGLSPEFIEKYGLSSRQAEVTEVMLLGKSDKEIAALLNIALNTVQVHLKHVYRKTGARGRYALMALVGVFPNITINSYEKGVK